MPSHPSSDKKAPSPERVVRGEQARNRGASGEDIAVAYLVSKGASILYRNWRPKGAGIGGECDIVAQSGDVICFVEVKTRQSSNYGEPQEAVGNAKRTQLERLARAWITQHGDEQTLRFDIIEIWWGENKNPRIAWIEGAFEIRI